MHEQILDREAALDRLDGDEELLLEIFQIFLDDVPRQMGQIRQAFEARDLKVLQRHAHSLKGASSNVGALKVQASAYRIELAARDGEWESIEAGLPGLEADLDEVLPLLREACP